MKLNKTKLKGIIEHLENTITNLELKETNTEWKDYYEANNNYDMVAFYSKRKFVNKCVKTIKPKTVWDLGANDGLFSNEASRQGAYTIAFDIDHSCVERNYKKKEPNQLPLLLDLTNPSSAIGWSCNERMSLIERGKTDMVFALALIHHLAIPNNVPLYNLAEFFSKICNYLVIEFVPKEDSQVKILLSSRKDIFNKYDIKNFETEFKKFFSIMKKEKVNHSERTMYLMEQNGKE